MKTKKFKKVVERVQEIDGEEFTYFLIIILALIFVLTFTPKSMDDFCISKGYEKATDFKGRLINATSQIECDKLEIFDVENDIVCKEFDKWGDCKRSTYFYRD